MRDIGARIRRYRLSRYGSPRPPLLSRLRWAWPILVLWLAYISFFSERSFYRIWRMGREEARLRADLEAARREIDRIEHQIRDPAERRALAERVLRERSGWARQGEIIYRIPAQAADSLERLEPDGRRQADAEPP